MTWVRESPRYVREGETRRYTLIWENVTTLSSPSDEVYANGSSQGVLTGSATVSGNTMQTRTLTVPAGAGGLTYVWEFSVTADGITRKEGFQLEVLKPGQEM